MSNLDAILKQYQNNTSNASKKMSNEERLKQYFTTYLPDGINSATKRIRILPAGENKSPIVEISGHKAQVNGQWKTFICPREEKDEDCPFCEARNALFSSGIESDKQLARNYSVRKMYVAKIIDRDHEEDGPKFWRFNHDYRKTGIFDKIHGVLMGIAGSSAPDIFDTVNGRDLSISIARDQNGRATVNSIVQGDPSPLSSDEEQSKVWLSNDKTWEDVYSVKPYSYLEIIVKGGEPTWKKNANGEGGEWVDKNSTSTETKSDDSDSELTIGGETTKTETPTTVVTETTKTETSTTDDEEEDDLPF